MAWPHFTTRKLIHSSYIYNIKKLIPHIALLLCLLTSQKVQSQLYYGVKGGYSIPLVQPSILELDDANDFFIYRLSFTSQTSSASPALIAYYRNELIYFQTELQYKSIKTTFLAENFIDLDNITTENRTKTTKSFDVPFVAGIRLDRYKIGVGPTFSFILSDNEIFQDVDFFDERRSSIETGFGFHFGIILYRLHIDLSYQARFNQVGDYLKWRNDRIDFKRPVSFIDLGLALMF